MTEEVYTLVNSEMTLTDALKRACKISRSYGKVSTGGNEIIRSIMNKQVEVLLLANDYETRAIQIITGLCQDYKIPIIKIESREELGRIVGFEKVNGEGKVKVYKCGVATIDDYCGASSARNVIERELAAGAIA